MLERKAGRWFPAEQSVAVSCLDHNMVLTESFTLCSITESTSYRWRSAKAVNNSVTAQSLYHAYARITKATHHFKLTLYNNPHTLIGIWGTKAEHSWGFWENERKLKSVASLFIVEMNPKTKETTSHSSQREAAALGGQNKCGRSDSPGGVWRPGTWSVGNWSGPWGTLRRDRLTQPCPIHSLPAG